VVLPKSSWELDRMRDAGRLVAEALRLASEVTVPGVTTQQIDDELTALITSRGGEMLFHGYQGFPAHICVSLNEEVVHGIPGPRTVRAGDIVSIDVGVRCGGYCADAAVTLGVGKISREARSLLGVTREALQAALGAMRTGTRLVEVSGAVQRHVEARGFSVVKKFVGHGIGREMHEPPQVPNFVSHDFAHANLVLQKGMVLAIEPMVNVGTDDVRVLDNGWTVVTADGTLSAHFEHTAAVTEKGCRVLTALDETESSE
jgi:methionyl aminopeptidase